MCPPRDDAVVPDMCSFSSLQQMHITIADIKLYGTTSTLEKWASLVEKRDEPDSE
jgi:hypothetical protein